MRSIRFPAGETISGIDAFSAVLPAGTLTDVHKRLLRRLFARYEVQGGRRDLIAPSKACAADPLKSALQNAYAKTYEGEALYSLRLALKALVGNRCPSCGGSRPGQLDHHLPKAHYPEFSLFPINLVALCGECNQRKSARVVGGPEQAFLHPYIDAVPAVCFLKFTVDIQAKAIVATVEFDENAPIDDAVLKARMRHQLDTIRVHDRLASDIAEFLVEKANNISDAFGDPDAGVVRQYLQRSAASADRTYTVGSWQSALLRALAADDNYCAGSYKIPLQVQLGAA